MSEWPGAEGQNVVKAPTVVKYTDGSGFKWGYELDQTLQEKIEGIKLLLDPEQPTPLYAPAVNTQAELAKLGKPAHEVATDYIRAIYNHAMKKIESKYLNGFISTLEKQFVLSVPAVWSDKAKDLTQRVCATY